MNFLAELVLQKDSRVDIFHDLEPLFVNSLHYSRYYCTRKKALYLKYLIGMAYID